MDIRKPSRKDIGTLGERIVADYLRRHGFQVIGQNISRKTGELDIVAQRAETLHIVEVKTLACKAFPQESQKRSAGIYSPADNLHARKIRKVARTAEWYAADIAWKGELQVDGALVWLRSDGRARITYLPHILA